MHTHTHTTTGVSPRATESEIKKAFHKLAQELHPDKTDAAEAAERLAKVKGAFAVLNTSMTAKTSMASPATWCLRWQVNEAFAVLKDAQKREAYDAGGVRALERIEYHRLRARTHPPPACQPHVTS